MKPCRNCAAAMPVNSLWCPECGAVDAESVERLRRAFEDDETDALIWAGVITVAVGAAMFLAAWSHHV